MFGRRRPLPVGRALRESVWPSRGWSRVLQYAWMRVRRSKESHHSIALGVAIGGAMSVTPLIGFHLVLSFGIALLARASLLGAAIGTILGNPLTFPLFWAATYRLGTLLLGVEIGAVPEPALVETETAQGFFPRFWLVVVPMMLGSLVLGLAAGLSIYGLTLWGLDVYKTRQTKKWHKKQK